MQLLEKKSKEQAKLTALDGQTDEQTDGTDGFRNEQKSKFIICSYSRTRRSIHNFGARRSTGREGGRGGRVSRHCQIAETASSSSFNSLEDSQRLLHQVSYVSFAAAATATRDGQQGEKEPRRPLLCCDIT